MRMSDKCCFAAGMIAGMMVLAGGILLKSEMGDMRCIRSKAADMTAHFANEAGHRISYMGRRLARRMR